METTSTTSNDLVKDNDKMQLNSIQLVNGAVQHIQFLRKLHSASVTLQEPSDQSIHRYLNLWLPLVADQDAITMIPPPDIAWLWHCHRLAPLRYEAYTLKQFGKVVESTAPFEFQEERDDESPDATVTRTIWESKYPDEPYYLNESGAALVCGTWQLDANGFDLAGSTSRQKMFLWHVSQPRFEDLKFIQDGVLNYQRFLTLKHGEQSMPLVPTFQIDLLWHTHIAMSVTQYNHDCITIRGEKFHHDDSMDDRTPGALLDRSFQETCQLWEKEYGESYPVPGGMYRGTPPNDYLDPSWDWEASQTARDISVMLAGSGSTGTTTQKVTEQAGSSIQKATTKLSHAPAGARSASSAATDPSDDKTPWKLSNGAYGVEITFIAASPRSTKAGVNSNPMKTGYVFGKGSIGVGYYSLETKDAYDILYLRLQKQHAKQMSDLACYKCCSFGSSVHRDKQLKKKQDDLVQTANMLAYLKARKEATGPRSALNDATVKKYREQELQRQHVDYAMYPYVPFYWNDTTTAGIATGSGGGGDVSGEDCFTNIACGAAGCGGGTCGGGGCGAGGGGCGGAACGGGGGGCGGGGGGGGCGGGGGG